MKMNISVECNTDHYLISSLIRKYKNPDIRLLHQRGKSGVVRRIMENNCEIGLIDEDPWANQPPGLAQFSNIEQSGPFKVLLNRANKSRLIIMCPYLEEIIVSIAGSEGLDPIPYGLQLDAELFHRTNPYRNTNYQRYLDELVKHSSTLKELFDLVMTKPED